jgi:hypothetical protein
LGAVEDNAPISGEWGIDKPFKEKRDLVGKEVQNLRENRVEFFDAGQRFHPVTSCLGLMELVPHSIKMNALRRQLNNIYG